MLGFAKQTNPSSFFSFTLPLLPHPKKTLRVSLSNCHVKADDQNRRGLTKRDGKKMKRKNWNKWKRNDKGWKKERDIDKGRG